MTVCSGPDPRHGRNRGQPESRRPLTAHRGREGEIVSQWDDRVNGHQAIQFVRQLAAAVSPLSVGKGSPADVAALHRAKEAQRTSIHSSPRLIPSW